MVEDHHITTTGPDYDALDEEEGGTTTVVYEESQTTAEARCGISFGSSNTLGYLE